MSKFENKDRYTVAFTQPGESATNQIQLNVVVAIECDSQSYMTAIEALLQMVDLSMQTIDTGPVQKIQQAIDTDDFPADMWAQIDLVDYGLLVLIVIGKPQVIQRIAYADFSQTTYHNIYDL